MLGSLGLTALRSDHEDARRYAAMRLVHAIELRDVPIDLKVAYVSALGIDPIASQTSAAGNREHDLASSSREALVADLLQLLGDREEAWQVRAHTATAVARLHEGASDELGDLILRELQGAVRKQSKAPEEVRRSALLGLSRLGTASGNKLDTEVRATLVRAAREGPVTSRCFALLALGRAGGHRGTGEEPMAGTDAARKELLDAVTRWKGTLRPWAALALGLLERGVRESGGQCSLETVRTLESRLRKGGSPSEEAALGIALGLCGDPSAYEAVAEAFGEVRDDTARGSLAVGLGLLGDPRAVEALEAVLKESEHRPVLFQECAIALALIGDRTLVPRLVERLEAAKDITTRAAIAGALGYVGDERCVDAFLELLAGSTNDRVLAARVLGRVCDPEALPWSTALAADLNDLAAPETLLSGQAAVLDKR
jgi:hypothetical protein